MLTTKLLLVAYRVIIIIQTPNICSLRFLEYRVDATHRYTIEQTMSYGIHLENTCEKFRKRIVAF